MLRRLIIMLLAFAAPYAAYWLFARWQARRGIVNPWPTAVLFLAGAAIAAEALIVAAVEEPRVRGGRYVPAHLENGRLEPARTVPDPDLPDATGPFPAARRAP